jgi:hypothetical protein
MQQETIFLNLSGVRNGLCLMPPLTTKVSACTGSHAAGEYLSSMTALDRPKLVAQISNSLSQKGYPRIQMTFIVAATGLAGFLSSVRSCFTWGWSKCGSGIPWPWWSVTACSCCS